MRPDPKQVELSAAILQEYMMGYDNPDDTINVALTHKQTALTCFALQYLNMHPMLHRLVGEDAEKLLDHIGRVGLAQKFGIFGDETQA